MIKWEFCCVIIIQSICAPSQCMTSANKRTISHEWQIGWKILIHSPLKKSHKYLVRKVKVMQMGGCVRVSWYGWGFKNIILGKHPILIGPSSILGQTDQYNSEIYNIDTHIRSSRQIIKKTPEPIYITTVGGTIIDYHHLVIKLLSW